MSAGRARAYTASWIAYASYYLGRKGFSVGKVAIAGEFGLGTPALAAIDTAFLATYALGQLPGGLCADRFGPRRVIAIGMLMSAAACGLMASAGSATQLGVWFALNGVAQASGWPASTKAMAQWTDVRERGRIMGVWSTCYQVGGIAATACAAWLLSLHGWRAVFWGPAIWLAAVGLGVGWMLRDRPGPPAAPHAGPVSVRSLPSPWRMPILYSYGSAYFCIKLIRYSLLFWLPFYLHEASGFDPVRSGYLATAFEVGGVLGSIGVGWLSDLLGGRRAMVALGSLLALAAALGCYAQLGHADAWLHVLALGGIGMLLFGPDALLSGAAAQDAGGEHAASAVGFVNGMGSAGAILQGALIAFVQRSFGWPALFRVFLGLALLAALCLWPARGRRARP
jgi:sugar phosphate permease